MRFAKISFLSLVLVAIGFVGNAEAADATANLTVAATVSGTCAVSVEDGGIAFGAYNPVAGNSADADLTVTCTNGVSYTVYIPYIDAETDYGMLDNAKRLVFTLFREVGHATAFGATLGTGLTGTGTGAAQTITVFGNIAAGLTPEVGSYSRTVVVTVNY